MVGADDETLSDEELLARIAGEDRHAFTILMRRHGQKVRGLALAFSGRTADADDITQDVFITLWRRPQAWRPGSAAFSTWLYRVVVNRCRDQARRRRIRGWFTLGEIPDPIDEAPSALEVLGGRERLMEVRRAIGDLPEKQRLALLLAIQGERSNAEIASILEVTEGAAEQLLVRARRRLRTMIDQMEDVR
jgi:RNA polymerase sigma-70 factor (ECF subfamily)